MVGRTRRDSVRGVGEWKGMGKGRTMQSLGALGPEDLRGCECECGDGETY